MKTKNIFWTVLSTLIFLVASASAFANNSNCSARIGETVFYSTPETHSNWVGTVQSFYMGGSGIIATVEWSHRSKMEDQDDLIEAVRTSGSGRVPCQRLHRLGPSDRFAVSDRVTGQYDGVNATGRVQAIFSTNIGAVALVEWQWPHRVTYSIGNVVIFKKTIPSNYGGGGQSQPTQTQEQLQIQQELQSMGVGLAGLLKTTNEELVTAMAAVGGTKILLDSRT
jgi:hypothetical protein